MTCILIKITVQFDDKQQQREKKKRFTKIYINFVIQKKT